MYRANNGKHINERPKSMKTILITILVILLAGCGTLYKAEIQPDGSTKWIPIMKIRSVARDLTYSKTTTDTNGTITTIQYSSVGTTAGIIGAGAQLMGAASSLSPL